MPAFHHRVLVAAALALLVGAGATAVGEVAHPRLFAAPKRLAAVRQAVKTRGSHHAEAFAAMMQRVNKRDAGIYDGGNANKYARSYAAREAALAYLVTEDKSYAELAFRHIKDVYTAPGQSVTALKGSGLARGMMSLGLGIPYDWCYPAWTAEQRSYVKARINEALDAWPKFGHANLGDVKGSNWVAVCRGGELVLLLGGGEEAARADRLNRLKRDLTAHMRNGFGDLGVSQEGAGYTEYPGGFLLPAVYALADAGDDELLKVARTRAWWKLAMYAHNFQPHARKFVMTGVAHSSNFDEGWASLLLNLAPAEHLPKFLWWYDRHMGTLAPGGPQEKFDHSRAGTVWSVLHYPVGVKAADPTATFPKAVADQRGYHFFRNRWKDADDILVTMMSDAHHHGHAWDQPEVFALNLMGFNTRFIGGPGKTRDQAVYSALLIDGKYNSGRGSTSQVGKTVAFEVAADGGYVIADGGALYKALGAAEARRHMLVKFSAEKNAAIVATLDRIKGGREHKYTWQANLGNEESNDGVEVTAGADSGRPTFLLRGRDNGYVKGWVLSPAAQIVAGDPLQVAATGTDVDLWVVMVVAAGRPPAGKVTGTGLGSVLAIDGVTVRYDAAKDRIVATAR